MFRVYPMLILTYIGIGRVKLLGFLRNGFLFRVVFLWKSKAGEPGKNLLQKTGRGEQEAGERPD